MSPSTTNVTPVVTLVNYENTTTQSPPEADNTDIESTIVTPNETIHQDNYNSALNTQAQQVNPLVHKHVFSILLCLTPVDFTRQ